MNNDSDENDEASQKNLPEFCIVCKTSDDWAQLIAAYELQRNAVDKELAGILKEQINLIRAIERKVTSFGIIYASQKFFGKINKSQKTLFSKIQIFIFLSSKIEFMIFGLKKLNFT